MNKRPLFVALSNQKGGVGKSTMAVLLAGYFHYVTGKRVVVVDCDYPQYSVNGLRGRDVKNLEKSETLQKMLYEQHERTGQKAYAVLTATAETAHETVGKYLAGIEEPVDIVFFDMPGTVNSKGVLKSIIHMDYVLTPIIQDRMVMQSSLSFVSAIQDFIGQHPDLPLRGIHLFWNRIDGRVSRNLYNLYNEVIRCAALQQGDDSGRPSFFPEHAVPALGNTVEKQRAGCAVQGSGKHYLPIGRIRHGKKRTNGSR